MFDGVPKQVTIGTITQRKEALRKMEDLGAQVEEALIFDNKSVTTFLSVEFP